MLNNTHITLITDHKLSNALLDKWVSIVSQLSTQNTIKDKKIFIKHIDNKYQYIIKLVDHLSKYDISFITAAWEHYYQKSFEINASDQYSLDDEELNVLLEKISKFLHNRWIDDSVSEGWRWGTTYNSKQKTHPALRNWDALPTEYRKILNLSRKEAVDFANKHL